MKSSKRNENTRDRKETERFKVFTYDELIQKDNVNWIFFGLRMRVLKILKTLQIQLYL